MAPLTDPFLDDPVQYGPPTPPADTLPMPKNGQARSPGRQRTRRPAPRAAFLEVPPAPVRRTSHGGTPTVAKPPQELRPAQISNARSVGRKISTATIRDLPMRKDRQLRRGASSHDERAVPRPNVTTVSATEVVLINRNPQPVQTSSKGVTDVARRLSDDHVETRPTTTRSLPVNPLRGSSR